jgi:serine/threonine-protein kinase HipA
VKFRGSDEPAEIGAEEYAYSLMAQEAGIAMPSTRLLVTARGGRYFAVQRFDRCAGGRLHVQTASGLLEADHRTPSIDYATLLKLTTLLTKDARDTRQMFRRMVLNVLAHNRDDHAKNHAYLMGPAGTWHPTPAYDVTLSAGPGGEHSLAVAGEGRAPSEMHMLKVAADAAIPHAEAAEIIAQVRLTVDRWPHFADQARLPQRRLNRVDRMLNGVRARISKAKNSQKTS